MEYTECINADKKASLYNKKPNYKDDDLEYASQKKVKNENEKEVFDLLSLASYGERI